MEKMSVTSEQAREEIIKLIDVIGEDREFADRKISPAEFLLDMDSIRFIELVTAVENKYDFTFEGDDMLVLKAGKLDEIAGLVAKKAGTGQC